MALLSKWKIKWVQKGQLPNVKGMMPTLLGVAANLARDEWIKVARSNLRTSRNEYISNIQPPEMEGKKAVIKLTGWLPNALEQGIGAFDMKPGFLGSSKARGLQNKYFTVPFPMKSTGSVGASPPVMPSSIYSLASKLQFGQSLKLPKTYEGYGLRSKLSQDMSRWGNYTWKTSPFQGVTKLKKFPGQRQSGTQYKTFRRVSRNSAKSSWIHPGFRSRDLMDRAVVNYESKISEVISQAVNG